MILSYTFIFMQIYRTEVIEVMIPVHKTNQMMKKVVEANRRMLIACLSFFSFRLQYLLLEEAFPQSLICTIALDFTGFSNDHKKRLAEPGWESEPRRWLRLCGDGTDRLWGWVSRGGDKETCLT